MFILKLEYFDIIFIRPIAAMLCSFSGYTSPEMCTHISRTHTFSTYDNVTACHVKPSQDHYLSDIEIIGPCPQYITFKNVGCIYCVMAALYLSSNLHEGGW